MRKNCLSLITLCVFVWFTACNTNDPSGTTDNATDTTVNTGDDSNDFVENQTVDSTVSIVWSGSSASVTGAVSGVTVTTEGGVVTITSSQQNMCYVLSGEGTGQLNIYSDYKFQLALQSLTLTCSDV